MCESVTKISESQISVVLTLRPTVFEITAILRQSHLMTASWTWTIQGKRNSYNTLCCPNALSLVHWMTPKYQWTLQDQSYIIYICITSIPGWQISLRFCSTFNRVRVTCHFVTSTENDPKIILNTTLESAHLCSTGTLDPPPPFPHALVYGPGQPRN